MKIVIVEDEIRIREGIAKLIKKLGADYEVLGEASDGEEGIALCLEKTPDLIITDIRMPKMDGIEMLSQLNEKGVKSKAIVVSAYSEFEYARGAMKLGVTEYLLKPISLMDFSTALNNVRLQIQEEQLKKPKGIGTLEQTVNDLYFGSIEINDEINQYLKESFSINPYEKVWIVNAYLGELYNDCDRYKRMLSSLIQEKGIGECAVIEAPFRQSLLFIVYNCSSFQELERWFQYRILQSDLAGIIFGCIEAENMLSMRKAYETLSQYMDWNVSFEKEILISYPKIKNIQTSICSYPMDAEAILRAALCSSDKAKVVKTFERFHSNFTDGKVYEPRVIKDCYVRFLWFAMELARDLGNVDARKIERQEILKGIMAANSKQELKRLSDDILEIITRESEITDNINDLTVKRAKRIIHEYYSDGITLEEIASKLGITPEYLGTKFRMETGVTFSNYMRDYRISKAKELLLGTNLKLYEIADKVGYNDPKYFSRVFKDATGYLPVDYRKMNN